ncbi:hypothetical protein BC940DRAFT_274196 [Gongronella butleri]|nr:hypothetical protein BC940DRAFT_274196 [Gongronella butleri]
MYGGRRQKRQKTQHLQVGKEDDVDDDNDDNQKKTRVVRPKIICTEEDRVLLVGEGNFSFAAALVQLYYLAGAERLTATCYDSEEVLYEKYGDEAKQHIETIRTMGGTVLFDIDATKMDKMRALNRQKYTKIIFNFPHAGKGIKDEHRNIESNQLLLTDFFKAATPLLTGTAVASDASTGEIYVTMKTGKPYDDWKIKFVAKWTGLLGLQTSEPFDPAAYPGYSHRRTIGFKEGMSKANNEEIIKANPRTFIFVPKFVIDKQVERAKEGKKLAKKNRQTGKHKKLASVHANDSDSGDEDNNF